MSANGCSSSTSGALVEHDVMDDDLSNQTIDVEEEYNYSKAATQEAKETLMRDMAAPVGYRRVNVPPKSATLSIVYDHGVRFEQDADNPDPKKHMWFCACSEKCRSHSAKGQAGIYCHGLQTGNITRHLKSHGTESDKTKKSTVTKAKHAAIVSDAKKAVRDSSDPGRLMMLLFVRVFITPHLFAFSLADSKDVRVFLNGNQEYIPKEVPALSTQQTLQGVPKRLSDSRSETEGISSTNNEEQENEYDELRNRE